MSSITKRPNGRWRARYRDSSKREHARDFKRKVDAQSYLDEVTTAVRTGRYVDPVLARMTVAEWSERWLVTYSGHRPNTVRQARVQIRRINERFGSRRLIDLRPSDIKTWTAEMAAEGLKPSTIYSNYRRLAQILGRRRQRRPHPPLALHQAHFSTSARAAALRADDRARFRVA